MIDSKIIEKRIIVSSMIVLSMDRTMKTRQFEFESFLLTNLVFEGV